MSAKVVLSQAAYAKIVLHVLKYPSQAVNGVLVGRLTAPCKGRGQDSEIEGATDGSIEVVDAVPLFHSQLGLAPMLELALLQVDEMYSDSKDQLSICGFYHANELLEDRDFNPMARKVASKIAEYFPQACALVVDNSKLPDVQRGISNAHAGLFQVYLVHNGNWQQSGPIGLKEPMTADAVAGLIEVECFHKLWDFEDHLNDVSRDWQNPTLLR